MSAELYWLTLTALMTSLFWLPYILNRLLEMGVIPAVMNPNADTTPAAPWAKRMMRAHTNAVENLVVFAPLAIAVHVTNMSTSLTAGAAATYFFARLAHFLVYSLGIPLLRTVTFAIGVACQIILAITLLQII